jgi:hypothetical protein
MVMQRANRRDGFGTKSAQTRTQCPRSVGGMKKTETAKAAAPKAAAPKAATPWGPAELVEELRLAQRVGDRRFSSLVQLLETPKGERLVRFAYATEGTARRGPVTLRARDLERLRAGLADTPGLRELLRL